MSVTVRKNFGKLAKEVKLSDRNIMRELGLLARERVIRRTLSGRDEDNAPFRPYAPGSKKRGTVNLQDTGQMLQAIGIQRLTDDTVVLGFRGGHGLRVATYHHVTGAGRSRVIRKFFGLHDSDAAALAEKYAKFLDRAIR